MKNYNFKNIKSNNADLILKRLVFCCLKHQILKLECLYDPMSEKTYIIPSFHLWVLYSVSGSMLSNLHACVILWDTVIMYYLFFTDMKTEA